VFLLARSPFFERGKEGASRTKRRIDGGTAKHGRDIWGDVCERHDGRRVCLCRMGEPFQRRERLFVCESQEAFMSLDTLEVEGDDTVEEGLIGRKDFSMLRLVVQCRSYRAGRLGHVCFLLAPCATPDIGYSMPRTSFQQARAQARTHLTPLSRDGACGGLKPKMSRKGNCWDNAAMESFFGSLKEECVGNTIYASHEEARLALFIYLEVYYNRIRRHSTLGYVSPLVYEQRILQQAKEKRLT
jgi:Integrase core domain